MIQTVLGIEKGYNGSDSEDYNENFTISLLLAIDIDDVEDKHESCQGNT